MSGLKGGGASKEAAKFEARWTVNMLFDLLAGSASELELEPPGTIKGFEFSMRRSQGREWHQVKHQNASEGKWSLAALKRVLTDFKDKLDSEDGSRCLFCSADSAEPLRTFLERARMSEDLERFLAHFLSKKGGKDFDSLREIWGDISEEGAYELLRRISTTSVDSATLRQANQDRARAYVAAEDPDHVVNHLGELIAENTHRRLDEDKVWAALAEKGWGPSSWRSDVGVPDAIRQVTTEFLERQDELLINDDLFAIAEIVEVLAALSLPVPASPVIVHGRPGCGKSTAMTKAIRRLTEAGWPVLTIDLRWIGGVASAEEMGERIGLPGAPADVLGGIVGDQRALLVIDGLDRVSAAYGGPQGLTEVVSEVLRAAHSHERLSVLLSCRSSDLENDVRVRSAISRFDGEERRIELSLWSAESVRSALVRAEIDPDILEADQLELLRVPQNLFFLVESRNAGEFDFKTENDLLGRYTAHAEVGP